MMKNYLSTNTHEIDYVDVPPNHFHHVHLRDKVNHLLVRVALFQHLDCYRGRAATAAAAQICSFRPNDLMTRGYFKLLQSGQQFRDGMQHR